MIEIRTFFFFVFAPILMAIFFHPHSVAQSKNQPKEIFIGIVLLDVDEIDAAEQKFTANVFFQARWQDSSLIHTQDMVIPLRAVLIASRMVYFSGEG